MITTWKNYKDPTLVRHKLWSVTQSIRLPSICTLCNQFHNSNLAVCPSCIQLMTRLGPACRYCAYPLADASYLICGHCIKKQPYFDYTSVTFQFVEPLRSLLHQFKYHNGFYLSSFLCHLITESVIHHQDKPLCLIPVPMHPRRMKERGFNQAAILAQMLAKKMNLICDLYSCQKIINTAPQATLDGVQRQKNLRHAFSCTNRSFDHVAIIDDLLTTGSTVNELAFTLKEAGAKRVDVWCCARTINPV